LSAGSRSFQAKDVLQGGTLHAIHLISGQTNCFGSYNQEKKKEETNCALGRRNEHAAAGLKYVLSYKLIKRIKNYREASRD
jgi:hypothetical protein